MNGRSWKVESIFQAEREIACVEPKEKVNGAAAERRGSILGVRLGCWQRLGLCAFSIKSLDSIPSGPQWSTKEC